jgi:hypothetical protein
MTLLLPASVTPPHGRSVDRRPRWAVAAVAVATAVGLALRIAAAGGDLGHDELYSLALATRLASVGDAFWGLPHDNNHPLNTAFLAMLGPGRASWTYRTVAVVLGTATVPAFAWAFWRSDRVTGGVAAGLAAVALPLVDFGSEARGYAGLTLASVVAVGFWERALALPPAPKRSVAPSWGLAAAAAFGTLSHPGMVLTIATLVAATLFRVGLARPGRRTTVRLFAPTTLSLAPIGAAFAVGIARAGRYKVGDTDPFAIGKLIEGLGSMMGATLGLPESVPAVFALALVVLGITAAVRHRLLGAGRVALAAAAFLILPAAVWAARPPNVVYARYYAICGVVLLLIEAESAGRLLRLRGRPRWWALAGLALTMAANASGDIQQIAVGRASTSATLAIMQREGGARYASDRPFMASLMLGGAPALSEEDVCGSPPDWFLAMGVYDPEPDHALTVGRGCALGYRSRASFASNRLSGTQWTLYRREH